MGTDPAGEHPTSASSLCVPSLWKAVLTVFWDISKCTGRTSERIDAMVLAGTLCPPQTSSWVLCAGAQGSGRIQVL